MLNPVRWLRGISKFFSSSISNRIITPYAGLVLLFAAFGIFVVTQLVVVGLEERLQNQLIGAGQVVSDEIVKREELRLEVERLVANTSGLADAIIGREVRTLEELTFPYIANTQDVDSLIIIDTQGSELLRHQRISAEPNALVKTTLDSGLNHYREWPSVSHVMAATDGSKETQLVQDLETERLIIYTVGPVRTTEGIVGVALIGTYLSKELSVLHNLALADIILFDSNGTVLEKTLVLDLNETEKEVFSVFTPARYQEVVGNRGKDVTLLDEIQIQSGAYRMAYAPFILRDTVYGVYGVALPTNFITESGVTNRNRLIAMFFLGVLAVIGVGYWVSYLIKQPIAQLVQTSQAIAKGNLNQRTGLQREDELGILANTFDNMTAELQKKTYELAEEASKLNAILSSIADGVMVQDFEGNVIRVNPAAEQILEAVGGDVKKLQDYQVEVKANTDKVEPHIKLLRELTGLEFHEAQRFEVGRRILSAISAPVITDENEKFGSVVVLRDITREVEAERLKDNFITSMSHELRTPLTAIKGYNDLLKMTAHSQLNERQNNFIGYIEQNVGDLLNLIQGVLDLSQIDAQSLGIDQEEFDLLPLITEETEKWVDDMEMKELSFTVHLPDQPVWVVGDQSRLSRVLHHLIKNAYEYTMPEGQVEFWVTPQDKQVQISLKDTGVGIAKEDQKFLFTRFYRAVHEDHGEEIHEVSGAGLGLYVSKAIVEAHEGQIWVESDLHQGSTFFLTLPTIAPPLLEDQAEDLFEYFEPEQVEQSEL